MYDIFFTVENNPPRAPAALSCVLISTQQVDLSARRGAQKKTAAGKPFFYDQAPNFRKPWRETRLSLRKSLCVEGVPSLDSSHQRTPFAIQEFIAMVSPLTHQHSCLGSWNNLCFWGFLLPDGGKLILYLKYHFVASSVPDKWVNLRDLSSRFFCYYTFDEVPNKW